MPIGILVSLILCSFLYVAVAAVITGMEPYPHIDVEAATRRGIVVVNATNAAVMVRVHGALHSIEPTDALFSPNPRR